MALSRRRFFRLLAHPSEKTRDERLARYRMMEEYVRNNVFPYDFALSSEQEAELLASVRADLEAASDEELFSAIVRFRVEETADRKIRSWREQILPNNSL